MLCKCQTVKRFHCNFVISKITKRHFHWFYLWSKSNLKVTKSLRQLKKKRYVKHMHEDSIQSRTSFYLKCKMLLCHAAQWHLVEGLLYKKEEIDQFCPSNSPIFLSSEVIQKRLIKWPFKWCKCFNKTKLICSLFLSNLLQITVTPNVLTNCVFTVGMVSFQTHTLCICAHAFSS